jgi:hypothetical protein
MATITKTPTKAPTKAVKAPTESTQTYRLPKDVSDWIEHASARLAYMTNAVEELKTENKKLRIANKLMEQRVMGQSQE